MAELRTLIFRYVADLWRQRWYAVAAAWAICVLGWIVVSRLPDYYQSSARVYMNSDEALTPLLRGIALDSNIDARLDRMQRTLLSVGNMKKVIRMTDLENRVGDAADRDALVAALQKRIVLKPQTRNLFTVSYTDTDPEVAQSVVSSVLSIFMESSAGESRTDIDSAQRFLQAEIDRLETQLRNDEMRKAEFESRYYDLLPDAQSGASELDQARKTVEQATQDLNDAVAERDSLQKQRDAEPQFVAPAVTAPKGNGGLSTSPEARLTQLETKLETAKATMTDLHPVVIALKHQIAEVKAEIAETQGNADEAGEGNVPNPVYRDLSLKLADKDADVASLRRKLAAAEQDRDRLEDEAKRAPGVAASFMNLNRDYGIVKKNYEELLERREAARISESADKKGDKIVIKTIDPPEVPVVPSGPNRPLFLSLVLVAGGGAGIGLAFVMSRLDSSYRTITALQEFGLPVLGSIARISALDRRYRAWYASHKVFASAWITLIILYGSLLLLFIDRHYTNA